MPEDVNRSRILANELSELRFTDLSTEDIRSA